MFIYYQIANVIFLPFIIPLIWFYWLGAIIFSCIALTLALLYYFLYYEETVLINDNLIIIRRAFQKKQIELDWIKLGCLCKTSFVWGRKTALKPKIVYKKIEVVRDGKAIFKDVPKITIFFIASANNIPQLLLLDSYSLNAMCEKYLFNLPLDSELARELIKILDIDFYINQTLFQDLEGSLQLDSDKIHLI